MGIFGLIQKLFSKEEETAELHLNELKGWLSEKTSSNLQDDKTSITERVSELNSLISSAKEKLVILENAQLKNENIEEKLKNFMSGNRSNYIKQVSMFLNNLTVPETNENLKQFTESATESFNILNKSARKSFYILQEFFAEESGKVAEDLKKIEDSIKSINSSLNSKEAQFLTETDSLIESLQNELDKKLKITSEIEEVKTKIEETEASILTRQKELETLEGTAGFKKIQETKDKIAKNEEALKNIDFQVTQMFSPLSRAFRKFEKVAESNVDILTRYNDPLNGLLFDTSFRILEVLREVRIAILKKEIELKDDDKVMKKINEITKEKLDNFKMSYFHLKEANEQLKRELKSNDTVYAHNDIVSMMKHSKDQLDKSKVKLENKTHDLNLINTDNQLEELSEKIRAQTNVKVTILL